MDVRVELLSCGTKFLNTLCGQHATEFIRESLQRRAVCQVAVPFSPVEVISQNQQFSSQLCLLLYALGFTVSVNSTTVVCELRRQALQVLRALIQLTLDGCNWVCSFLRGGVAGGTFGRRLHVVVKLGLLEDLVDLIGQVGRLLRGGLVSLCLLYTSDAADDAAIV